jgi:antitoxin HicB
MPLRVVPCNLKLESDTVTKNERKQLEYYLTLKYPISIGEVPEGGYFFQIKDLPGCYSQGETVEEALKNIEEALK